MMLRKASSMAASAVIRRQRPSSSSSLRKNLVTSAQKRALDKQQLAGDTTKPAAAAAAEAKTDAGAAAAGGGGGGASIKPASTGASGGGAASGGGGGGGGGGMLPLLGLGIVGAGGAAYYYDMIPFPAKDDETPKEEAKVVAEKEPAAPVEKVEEKPSAKATEKEEEEEKTEGGSKVTQISFPEPDYANRPPQIVPSVAHDPNGSRVDIQTFFDNYIIDVNIGEEESAEKEEEEAAAAKKAAEEKEAQPVLIVEEEEATEEVTPIITPETAQSELTTSPPPLSQSEKELLSAHTALRANLNESFLKDLDTLSTSELRIRVVQLVSEMEERTKWEAVRLKEFLGMKEKETAEKYLEAMQKQRHEFEDLLAQRLREQEDILSRAATNKLQEKEDAIQSVISASLSAQQSEHELELSSTVERITRETEAKYEAEYGTKLAKEKMSYNEDLKEKVEMMSEMVGKLKKMEEALEVSRSFESGSQKAHRISAAALALMEKMQGSASAAVELAALKASAGDDGVIAAALSKVPSAVQKGVPTLSELQAKFDKVHAVSREAALVPEGRIGLEGQLLGILFAKLTIPPSPDAALPPPSVDATAATTNKEDADYILAKAHKHVHLGDLERAVEELDKLKGQTAFTVKDWKKDALDRISVEKALKVIKMECALMNENMSGGSSA